MTQKDYTPPAIAGLEEAVIGLFSKHIKALEAAGADDEQVFSALRAVSEAAHLSGYLQDLLRYTTDGQPLHKAPVVARAKAVSCDICGCSVFVSGPAGRLAAGRPPQCRDCGSLERHRLLHRFFAEGQKIASLTCLSVADALHKGARVFRSHSQASVNDIVKGAVESTFDVVVSADTLRSKSSVDPTTLLKGLVRVLHEKSTLVLYESTPRRSVEGSDGLGTEVAQRLPNADVLSTKVVDRATGAIGTIVVAAPKGRSSSDVLALTSAFNAGTKGLVSSSLQA
jgi:hypothetical protein